MNRASAQIVSSERARESLIHIVSQRTATAMVLTDREGRTLWLNPRFETMTGYSLAEMAGRKPGNLLQGPLSDPAAIAKLREAVCAGRECTVQLVNYTRTGSPYWTDLELHPARDEAGEVSNFIALQRDITNEKLDLVFKKLQIETLKEITAAPSVFDALRGAALGIGRGLNLSHVACFAVSDGKISCGEWLASGRPGGALSVPKTLADALEAALMEDAGAGPGGHHGDWSSRRVALTQTPDVLFALACGRPVWGMAVLLVGKGDLGSGGNGLVRLLEHVGEAISNAGQRLALLRSLEQQRSHAEAMARNAADAAAQLQEAQDKLLAIARVAALQTMIGGVAHEIAQPLAALGNYLGVLRLRLASPDDRSVGPAFEIVERANEQLLRCTTIMQKVRDFGGMQATVPAIMRLRDLVDEAVSLSLIRERDPGLCLSVAHSEEPVAVVVDPAQLKLVIINLLNNAVDSLAGSRHRQVEVRTTVADDSWVRLSVSDGGAGVPTHIEKRLFQPFVTSKPGGHGLGLAVCRTIVEAAGGTIWHERGCDGGARFNIRLKRSGQPG